MNRGRRLGKVLVGRQLLAVKPVARRQFRQRVALLFRLPLIPAFQVQSPEAGELEHRAGGPEVINGSRVGRHNGIG